MACSMFDDRDGFIDEADPVSPLSNPDAGAGTAVLERPEEETKLDDGGNGTGTKMHDEIMAAHNGPTRKEHS